MSEERADWSLERASASPDETFELGRVIGTRADAGQGIVLSGEMGAGKTVFVRGLAQGLGVDEPGEVCSPTYLLMMEHAGPKPLLHLDAYFAERSREFLEDGGDAYVREGFVLAVEWPDRLGIPIPEDYLRVAIRHVDEERRLLRISGNAAWRARLESVLQLRSDAGAR